MAYCGQATPANAKYLASKTGLDPTVALAWLKNECQSVPNPTNPLNILYYGNRGQIGKRGRFGVYASTQSGLDAAAWLVNNSAYYAGIRKAIKSGDPREQARAIELSPWAGGNYGASKSKLGGISRTYQSLVGKAIDWSKTIINADPISTGSGAPNTNPFNWSPNRILSKADLIQLRDYLLKQRPNEPGWAMYLNAIFFPNPLSNPGKNYEGKKFSELQGLEGFSGLFNPNIPLSDGGLLGDIGDQIKDTFTWIGFIFVGLTLLIVGALLISGFGGGSKES